MADIRARAGAGALAAAGALFLLYPAVRPWRDESTAEGATEAMSSGAWIASHFFAMIGFILVALALLAVAHVVGGTRGASAALAAVVTGWLGAGLTLPYYGAETYGLHAVASEPTGVPGTGELLELVDATRFQPVAVTTFGVGLLSLAVAAILAAVAVWRSEVLPRAGGILFAIGFALFLPQFFAPAAVRIGHGIILAAGCVWLAAALWRTPRRPPQEDRPWRSRSG